MVSFVGLYLLDSVNGQRKLNCRPCTKKKKNTGSDLVLHLIILWDYKMCNTFFFSLTKSLFFSLVFSKTMQHTIIVLNFGRRDWKKNAALSDSGL